jgi:hypothetical protein
VEHGASAAGNDTLDGADTYLRSPGATDDGTSLLLVADASGVQFGVYQFTPASSPLSVDVALDSAHTSAAWIGVADFTAQRWRFSGPCSAPQNIGLDAATDESPQGHVYVAVVAAPIASAKVDQLVLHGQGTPPVAAFANLPQNSGLPLTMGFDASASRDPDGSIVKYEWDMDHDGVYELDSGSAPAAQHVFTAVGAYTIGLRVTDDGGATAETSRQLEVWNDAPVDSAQYAGDGCSLAMVDGRPAISYSSSKDSLDANLMYIRAADAAGGAWGSPVVVANPCHTYTQLLVVDGHPAICYQDVTDPNNPVLKFVRAADADGAGWNAPVLIDSAHSAYQAGFAIVDGKPAVGYRTFGDTGGQSFCQAADADGTAWNAPVLVDGNAVFGPATCSMAVADGNPALTYSYEFSNLRYVRANDPDGATWPDSTGLGIPNPATLYVVDGNPAILYLDSGPSIRFMRAADAQGATWNPPATVADGIGLTLGNQLCGATVNGVPTAAYLDDPTGQGDLQLMFASALDADGNNWQASASVASP